MQNPSYPVAAADNALRTLLLLHKRGELRVAALYPTGVPDGPLGSRTDLARLGRELAVVRRRGYAYNLQESERGVNAVGACIRDRTGQAPAAIAIAAPASRTPRGRLTELA